MSYRFNLATPDDPFGDLEQKIPDDGDDTESLTSSEDENEDLSPEEQILEDLESDFNLLTLEAQTIIAHQPRATQVQFTVDTRKLFNDYQQHGSMARLKVGLEKFLERGDDGGKLEFEDAEAEKANTDPGHFGEVFMINNTADDDQPKYVDGGLRVHNTVNAPKSTFNQFHIVDSDSIPHVTNLPWDPVATVLRWPGSLQWPRGLLSRINQILSIVDHESRVRLFHHISKYGPSPVFRVGIAQHVESQYSTILETSEDNYLGLTPESRSFLRSVFESAVSLNRTEIRMLAQACRIAEESVKIFWEDFSSSRRGYNAMKMFMMAREVEKSKEARLDKVTGQRSASWNEYEERRIAEARKAYNIGAAEKQRQQGRHSEASDTVRPLGIANDYANRRPGEE